MVLEDPFGQSISGERAMRTISRRFGFSLLAGLVSASVLALGLGPARGVGAASALAADRYWTPQVGDPDRKAILDALRPVVVHATGGPVLFVVDILRTDGRWAYIQGAPQRPGGKPLDWMQTRYAAAWANDAMSDVVMGLVMRMDGRWSLVDHVIGPTDVYWYGWLDRYGLPEALFWDGR